MQFKRNNYYYSRYSYDVCTHLIFRTFGKTVGARVSAEVNGMATKRAAKKTTKGENTAEEAKTTRKET